MTKKEIKKRITELTGKHNGLSMKTKQLERSCLMGEINGLDWVLRFWSKRYYAKL